MERALSLYLGGMVVEAKTITSYEAYKNLGLICPFCKEAVFYRASSVPRKFGKGIVKASSACFSHYFTSVECEIKSKCGASPQFFHNLSITGKNQRLKIYNLNLWELFVEVNKLTHKDINYIKNIVGRKKADRFIEGLVEAWKEVKTDMKEQVVEVIDRYERENYLGTIPTDLKPVAVKLIAYFENPKYNRYMHTAICNEVIDYLGTFTGRTVLRKLITYALVVKAYIDRKEGKEIEISGKKLLLAIANVICVNHWMVLLDEKI